MLKSVEGVYKDGAVQIFERPSEISEARGIDEAHAADLRARLRAFADDWERPDMEAYDAL